MMHTTDPYLLNPTHRITVNLIGLGGTGSNVLTGLYRLNEALIGIGHTGLLVRAWDADIVSEANIGRQLFSPADIGFNKAVTLITRVNRYAGYDWEAMPVNYSPANIEDKYRANITISCVDTIAARIEIGKMLATEAYHGEPNLDSIYWLDYGNGHKTGQCVLGTIRRRKDNNLKTVLQLFPTLKKQKDIDSGPSCSLAQALGKQDLYINSTLAQLGLNILWKLFREGRIKYQGAYLNLDTLSVNPIKIV